MGTLEKSVKPLYKDGKLKCFTLSYDDGVTQDTRLVKIFDRYGLKCTFNLNSGLFGMKASRSDFPNPVTNDRLEENVIAGTYKNHEIAVHTLTHPKLQYLGREEIDYEILEDRKNLERITGAPVTGMAYPYGTYDGTVLEELRKCGIRYSRTTEATWTYSLPRDFLRWHPSIHFGDDRMDQVVKTFLDPSRGKAENCWLPLLYVWGHSYELDGNDSWTLMENFCREISARKDVWYATNGEIERYVTALRGLIFSADKSVVRNPSADPVWLQIDGETVRVGGGETKKLEKKAASAVYTLEGWK